MVVPRQGRREPPYQSIRGRLRTRPRGEQRAPAAQTVFRQTLLGHELDGAGAAEPERLLDRDVEKLELLELARPPQRADVDRS
jgi:hypothetical protein